jgi:hypothetical protein
VAARRAIVAECLAAREDRRKAVETIDGWPDRSAPRHGGRADALEFALRALAAPYADHPGYKREWRAHP